VTIACLTLSVPLFFAALFGVFGLTVLLQIRVALDDMGGMTTMFNPCPELEWPLSARP
jgi:hypothetical protein